MRCRVCWMTLLGAGLLALPALAQPPAEPAGGPPPADPAMKQKLLDAFDTNKDGNIDRTERQAIRRAMIENFGPGGLGPGPAGRGAEGRRRGPGGPPPSGPPPGGPPPLDQGQAPDAGPGPDVGPGPGPADQQPAGPRRFRRGPEGRGPDGRRGPGGPGGPPPPMRAEALFDRLDADDNDQLSLDEFKKLRDVIREHMPRPPWDRRGGPGFDRRGPDGPPRGEFGHRGPQGPRGWWRQGPPGPGGPPPGPGDPPPPADNPPPEGDAPEEAI